MLDTPHTQRAFRKRLHAWYHAERRTLPWREAPTPYHVWVSEIMLQQTQVATVIPYFERFIARFPNVQSLAEAPEEAVLAQWAGLGYYRRCRHLHKAAKEIVRDHDGELPGDLSSLLSLSGVGRYTAGAIASIAFGIPASVLDGNVARVLSRLVALEEESDSSAGQRKLWALADTLLCTQEPSAHNQAMMELGALICSPKAPLCDRCPVEPDCKAHALGTMTAYPRKRPKKSAKPVFGVAGLAIDPKGRTLMARRPDDVLLGGLWELPWGEIAADSTRPAELRKHFKERSGLNVTVGARLASVQHIFTHRRLTLEVYRVSSYEGTPNAQWYTEVRWVDQESLASLPLSRLTEKVLNAVGHDTL